MGFKRKFYEYKVISINIEDEIKNIIDNEINEKPTIDYKIQEYNLQSNDKWEVIKDVIAMLNSEEAFGESKFIILGVAEKGFYVKGLEKSMRDDNEYQNLFEFINPRPHVETGQISRQGKTIGYIFIDKNNNGRPYTISQDNERYYLGTSFIRKGTKNDSLDDISREKMILEKRIKQSNFHEVYQSILEQNAIKSEVIYQNGEDEGKKKIDPSNNNGKFVIGEGIYEFAVKFDVANNGVARIMNDYGIQVARAKGQAKLFDKHQELTFEELDFTNRLRRYDTNDLAVIVNKMGAWALIIFLNIESESHGAYNDLVSFKWKIIR